MAATVRGVGVSTHQVEGPAIHVQALCTQPCDPNKQPQQPGHKARPPMGQRSTAEFWQPPAGLVVEAGEGVHLHKSHMGSSLHTCG